MVRLARMAPEVELGGGNVGADEEYAEEGEGEDEYAEVEAGPEVIRLMLVTDDLLLEVEYAAHPQFEVDGRNIIHALALAPWEAALGANVSVPTLGGSVELKIPADSEAGRKLRLRGRGLPGSGSAPAGDQIVELEILAPRAHSDGQRDAYRELRDAFGNDWRRA